MHAGRTRLVVVAAVAVLSVAALFLSQQGEDAAPAFVAPSPTHNTGPRRVVSERAATQKGEEEPPSDVSLVLRVNESASHGREVTKGAQPAAGADEDVEEAQCRNLLLTWECMTVAECLAAHPVEELLAWTPLRARSGCTKLFRRWPCSASGTCHDPKAAARYVPGDLVARSQLQAEGQAPPPYVPPEQRTPTPFPEPFVCRSSSGANVTIYPMAMGAAREMYLGERRRKLFKRVNGFSDLYPKRRQAAPSDKNLKPFGINDEIFGVIEMGSSRFGLTTKRWGWDCLRHYEYGAYGVLPYFVDLPVAPSRSVSALPRALLLPVLSMPAVAHNGALWILADGSNVTTKAGDALPGKPPCEYGGKPHSFDGGAHVACTHRGTVDETLFQPAEYDAATSAFTAYAETYLTTASIAASLLQRAAVPHARRVLLVLLQGFNEFNQMSLHHGLVDLGLDVTVFPPLEGHFKKMRKNVPNLDRLEAYRYALLRNHGNGYMWGFRVYDNGQRATQDFIIKQLEDKTFDVVIFAGFNSGRPETTYLFKQVTMAYSADKIIFVQTTDAPFPSGVHSDWSNANLYGKFFMREVQDRYDECPSPVPVPSFDPKILLARSPYPLAHLRSGVPIPDGATEKQWCDEPLPEFMVHDDDSAVLLDGHHWGFVYIGPLLASIRRVTQARIVMLCPHSEAYESVLAQKQHEFRIFKPIGAFLAHNATILREHFLLHAARQYLTSAAGAGLTRVVISSSLEAFWKQNLFRFVGPSVYVPTYASHVPLSARQLGSCGMDVLHDSMLAHFSTHTIAGDKKQLLMFLALIEKVGGFAACSNEMAVNAVLHGIDVQAAAPGLSVTAWRPEHGPVVLHDGETCRHMKEKGAGEAATLCGNPNNGAVLIHRCSG